MSRRPSLRFAGALFTLGAISAVSWAGCGRTEPTELVAGFTTQIQVPKQIKGIGVHVRVGQRVSFCDYYPVDQGTVNLPSTLGTLHQEDGASLADPVTVTILGFRSEQDTFQDDCFFELPDESNEEVLVLRRRRTTYLEDRILYLPLPMKESCSFLEEPCADDQTCVGGVCESAEVDPGTLAEFREDMVFGTTNTCFDPSICMPEQALIPLTPIDAESCTFQLPEVEGAPAAVQGNLNVRVVYASFGSEIMDLDDKEGFVLDPSDPTKFSLAPNICQALYSTGKIIHVAASPVCPAKRALQPICEDALSSILNGTNTGIKGDARTDLCTRPAPLIPTESALYVLMDRSASMAEYFGPEGLQAALETPLSNPIAKRTQVGFSFLPADASECTAMPSAFLSPSIGPDVVDNVRDQIGALLGDSANVLATDPMLNLDAALRLDGAYQALANFTPQLGSSFFNRRALMIIGNRDFQAHCGGANVATLAQDAFDQSGIFTYTVVLDAPGTAEQFGGNPIADAAAIATAGGTEGYDATENEAEGALAVQEIVNDLGSCVYDPPEGTPIEGGETLTYLNPVSIERTDIEFNPNCSAATANTETGWGLESTGSGNGVRVCGASCDAFQDVLTDVAVAAALQDKPAQSVELRVSVSCDQI